MPTLLRFSHPIKRHVGAVLVTDDGKYLMQLRDDRTDVDLGGHWGLFGGAVESGEEFEEALLRELKEELEFIPKNYSWLTELAFSHPEADIIPGHKVFFEVGVSKEDLAKMVQHEGSSRQLFGWPCVASETKIVPWDACALLIHARLKPLFR